MKSVLFISWDCWKDQIKLYIGKCLKTSKFYTVLKIPTLGRQWSLLSFRKSRIRWLLTWSLSHVRLFATPWTIQSMEFSRSEYWVGSLFLLRGIFPTQGSNPGLLHWRQILYQLSHQGSPRILEWVAMPFSRGSSWPRYQTQVFCTGGRFFTVWATREAQFNYSWFIILC